MQTKLYVTMAFVGLLGLTGSALLAETPDERAVRIKAAQDALKQAQEDAASPEALKARVVELEAENRRLRAQVAKLLTAMKEAGLKVGGVDENAPGAADDQRKKISSFDQLFRMLPDDVMPRRNERSDSEAWTAVHQQAMEKWFRENAGTFEFHNLRVRAWSSPNPLRNESEEGWYSVQIRCTVPRHREPSGIVSNPAVFVNGVYWVPEFYVYLRATNERQKKALLELKRLDEITISGMLAFDDGIEDNGGPDRLYRFGTRFSGSRRKGKRYVDVGLRGSIVVTDFK